MSERSRWSRVVVGQHSPRWARRRGWFQRLAHARRCTLHYGYARKTEAEDAQRYGSRGGIEDEL